MFQCVKCGRTDNLEYYSLDLFGMICPNCKKYSHRNTSVMPSSLYAMQYVISTDIEKLYGFIVKDDVFRELDLMIGSLVRKILDHPLKSEEMLDLIFGI